MFIIHKSYLKVFIQTFFLMLMTCLSPLKAERKPNIIFVLADDLGYMDLPSYAAHIKGKIKPYYETPHLNKIISESVMFTQAYAYSLCSPTRASVITGKETARLGFMTATPGGYKTYYNQGKTPPQGFYDQDGFHHAFDRPFWPINQGMTNIALAQEETTIAEALEGYQSYFLGKWHLGGHGSEGYRPSDQGFKEVAWFDAGGSAYFNWRQRWDRKLKVHEAMAQEFLISGMGGEETGESYLTDDLAAQASRVIRAQEDEKDPFFLYFCHFAVHTPLQAKQDMVRHFNQKANKGWNGQNNPTYAAMLKSLDNAMGHLFEALKDSKQLNHTIVIFMSDNGGIVKPNKEGEPTFSSNAPFKGEKALLYEGGVRVPLFVWQPKLWKPSVCDTQVDVTDIFPTIMEMASQQIPHRDELDGQSILPLLKDPKNSKNIFTPKPMFWHYPFYVSVGLEYGELTAPRSAVRQGEWKLILNWEGQLELYNITHDPGEEKECSSSHPEVTTSLLGKLTDWINETVEDRYIPSINPRFKASHAEARPFENIFEEHDLPWPTGRPSRLLKGVDG